MALSTIRCGNYSFLFDESDGGVRHLAYDGVEVLRGIYAAVRDRNWDTVAPQLADLRIYQAETSVRIRFVVDCVAHPVDFTWQGSLVLDAISGRLTYDFRGTARRAFLKNRIGFCVLHAAECAGSPVTVEHVDARVQTGVFPAAISPHQPFLNLQALTHEPVPGLTCRVAMAGDVFEMEDQRNWTDASFKTYCTPLGRPFPVEVLAGDIVSQTIRLELTGRREARPEGRLSKPDRRLKIERAPDAGSVPLPAIGFGASRDSCSDKHLRAVHRLASLRPAHLRVDLKCRSNDLLDGLVAARDEARPAGAKLEIAIHLSGRDPTPELGALKVAIETAGVRTDVGRWLVFCEREKTTSSQWLEAARAELGSLTPSAAIVGGTDAYFAELNRGRPPMEVCDAVTFSMNPQVHAFDDLSLIETLPIQADVVQNARQWSGGKPVIVSPITLKPRFNPNSTTTPEHTASADDLAATLDARQSMVFGALWTLGSLKYVIEAGAASVTYYRVAGEDGLFLRGSGVDSISRSESSGHEGDEVYPVWHIFRALADFSGGRAIVTRSSDPLTALGLMLAQGPRRRLLIAHFGSTVARVRLPSDVPPGTPGRIIIATGAAQPALVETSLPSGAVVQWDWLEKGCGASP